MKCRTRMIDKILTVSLVVFLASSCHQKDRHKLLIETNRRGDTISKIPYYVTQKGDSLCDGVVIKYYDNHIVSDSFQMSNGFKNGFYYEFDSLGRLKSKMQYYKNKFDGLIFDYFPDGKPEVEELVKRDTLLYVKNYFPGGHLKSYLIYIEKDRTGYYLIYDSLGRKTDESGDSNRVKRW